MLCFLAATTGEQKEAAKGTHGLFARENGPQLSYYDQVDLFRRILKFNNFPLLCTIAKFQPTCYTNLKKKTLGSFGAAPALLSLCPGN